MPRACTVCTHPQRSTIDRALIAGNQTNQAIASAFGINYRALGRHRSTHLGEVLAKGAQLAHQRVEQQAARQAHAEASHSFDVFASLTRQIGRLEKLSDAVDEWLQDPEDPNRYSIDPRTEDILVIYTDWNDTDQNGKPKRKRQDLASLLDRVRDKSSQMLEPERAEIKTADPRTLMGAVADSLKGQMQLSILLLEKLYNAQAIEAFEASVLDAVEEVSPDVRHAIEHRLRAKRPLRRALGSPLGFA